MKNYFTVLIFGSLFVSGCYTSNQMVISGNRSSGGGNGVQRSNLHSTPSQSKPKPQYVSQKQNNPNTNKSNNANVNTQTTTIYLTNNPSSNTVTNTTTFSSPTGQPTVKEFTIEESVIPGRYYIIQ